MEVIYNIDKKINDKGFNNWRLSFRSTHAIYISVQNFDEGYFVPTRSLPLVPPTKEKFDEIYIQRKNIISKSGTEVSLMTRRGYEYLMSKYDEVLQVFYNNILDIINAENDNFKYEKSEYDARIRRLNEVESSKIFLPLKREQKIKVIY